MGKSAPKPNDAEDVQLELLTTAYNAIAEDIKSNKKLQKRITGLQLIEHVPFLYWVVGCAQQSGMSYNQWSETVPINIRAMEIARRQLDNMETIIRRYYDEVEQIRKEQMQRLKDREKKHAGKG